MENKALPAFDPIIPVFQPSNHYLRRFLQKIGNAPEENLSPVGRALNN
jgi:hypothetical protein